MKHTAALIPTYAVTSRPWPPELKRGTFRMSSLRVALSRTSAPVHSQGCPPSYTVTHLVTEEKGAANGVVDLEDRAILL